MRKFLGFTRFLVAKAEHKGIIYKCKYEAEDEYWTPKDLSEGLKPDDGLAFQGHLPPISKENELEAWKYMKDVVDKALKAYPNTLEEDL